MDCMAIFGLQFLLSFVVSGLIAKWFISPLLASKPGTYQLSWCPLFWSATFSSSNCFWGLGASQCDPLHKKVKRRAVAGPPGSIRWFRL